MSEPPERRDERRPISLDVSAWSLVQPTRLLTGTTVQLDGDGALLRLTGLTESAVQLDLRISLPERALHVSTNIVERRPPDLVVVSFDWVDSYERARLGEFLRTAG
jgi:hypothetical protein